MRNTPNYNLPQYEGTDKFTKEVLNDAFTKVDTAINDLQETFNINGTGGALITQEVVNARNGKQNLKERIDEIDEQYKEIVTNNIPQITEKLEDIVQDTTNKFSGVETKKADKTALDVERQRIDKFTSLGEGSTTGDAELIDGRVGADGVVYSNIGSAIRTQIANSEKNKKQTINLFNVDTIAKGKQLNSNGSLTDNASYNVSDFIPVTPNSIIFFYAVNFSDYPSGYRVFFDFYDENKTWLSRNDSGVNTLFTTTSYFKSKQVTTTTNTYYVRVQYASKLTENEKIMITQDEVAMEYIPNKILNDYSILKVKDDLNKTSIIDLQEAKNSANLLNKKQLLNKVQINKVATTINKKGYFIGNSQTFCLSDNISLDKNTLYRLCFFDVDVNTTYSYSLILNFFDELENIVGSYNISSNIWTYTDGNIVYKRFKISDFFKEEFKTVRLQYSNELTQYNTSLVQESKYSKFFIEYKELPYAKEDEIKDYIDKKINNSTTVSNGAVINSTYVNGLNCKLDDMAIVSNGVAFDYQSGIYRSKLGTGVFSHDSTLIGGSDNKLYCVIVKNDVNTGDSPGNINAYTQLCVVDSVNFGISSVVNRYDVLKYNDTVLGQKVISGVGVPNLVFIDNNTLRIIFSAKLEDNKYYMFYRDFNTSTNTFGDVKKCSMVVNGNVYEFSTNNINANITTINNLDYFISINAQISKNTDGYYYCGVCVGNQIESSLIFRSLDLISFELWLQPSFTTGSKGVFEGACICSGGYLYYALRQGEELTTYADGKMLLAKIDIATKQIVDEYKIKDTVSRACWLEDNGKIYLLHGMFNRQRLEVIELNTNNLGNSRIVMQCINGAVYPSFIKLNGNYYFSATGSSSTTVYLRRVSNIINYNLSDIQNKLASLLRITDDLT